MKTGAGAETNSFDSATQEQEEGMEEGNKRNK
jgi:hypothetical protein